MRTLQASITERKEIPYFPLFNRIEIYFSSYTLVGIRYIFKEPRGNHMQCDQ